MLRSSILGILILFTSLTALASKPPAILPGDVEYDPAIPTPRSYLGFKIGDRHIQHHELVGYLRVLASASDRVTLQEYARSHGGRPLVLLTITSVENHKRLNAIRRQHLQLTDAKRSAAVDIDRLPAVINMGYSVHGNEASGGNVAPLVAYYLAAAKGKAHQRLLREVVVLLDPCLNPDGFSRFANWANNHRGRVANSDPNHREHQEPWPSGRTNYYWFDLNRDWLPAQHPESQGRLAQFHRWKPNVVLDFHEMGTDSTYFFQPGVPKRNNPLTPQRTIELTRAFAKQHAAALDEAGSLYFSEEVYDDFYMGKGSTYPDLHGAIGILFEQASVRGHVRESSNGPLTFSFAIRNHWLTSMSSLRATLAMRRELLEHKRQFYRDAQALVRTGSIKGYVVTAPRDEARLYHFLEILARHDIVAHRLEEDLSVGGYRFPRQKSFVIPAAQKEFRFLQDLFARRTEFAESIFYDVSTWNLPLAFQIRHATLETAPKTRQLGKPFRLGAFPRHSLKTTADDLAYVIPWDSYYTPKTLYQLLNAGIKVKVATRPFQMPVGDRVRKFGYGTLLVPLGIQREKRGEAINILRRAGRDAVAVYPAKTGLTSSGIDFGSGHFRLVPKPKILLVTGASAYEAGEVWHLLDQRMAMPVTLVEAGRLANVQLREYSVVVMVSGSYDSVSERGVDRLRTFLKEGGTVVATGTAIRWLDAKKLVSVSFRAVNREQSASEGKISEEQVPEEQVSARTASKKSTARGAPPLRRPYASAADDAALRLVRGAIFRTRVDPTHPIGYGFTESDSLPVFRNHRVFLELTRSPYSTPVVYDDQPLLSGYVSPVNLKALAGSAGVAVYSMGKGRAILIADNPNFRAFWYGTNRIFLNSLFFGPLVRVP